MLRSIPLLALAACASAPASLYVPGGDGLPKSARRAYRLALQQEREGDKAAAMATLTELCSRHPTRLGFHLRRLRVAREHIGSAQAALLYRPPPPGVDATRAEILSRLAGLRRDELADRTELLRFAIRAEPTEAFWPLALADVELALHDPAVVQAARQRRRGRLREAESLRKQADLHLDRAIEQAERALQFDPRLAEAQLLIGYVCALKADAVEGREDRNGWRRQADERYGRALALDPESVPALLDRAENQLYFGRYTRAIRDLRRAAGIAPGEALVWNNLGSIYYETGQLSDAIDAYEQSLALDPSQARTRTAYSDCLRRDGDAEGAVRELKHARMDAGGDDALRAEIAFKLGTIYEFQKRYREAVQEYELHIHHVEEEDLPGGSAAKARSRIRSIIDHAFLD